MSWGRFHFKCGLRATAGDAVEVLRSPLRGLSWNTPATRKEGASASVGALFMTAWLTLATEKMRGRYFCLATRLKKPGSAFFYRSNTTNKSASAA